jgi:hypothetical protein
MVLILPLVFLLASAADVIDCIRLDCATYTLGTCGKYNQTLTSVQVEACSNGKGCYASDVQAQYLKHSANYPCLTLTSSYDYSLTDQSKRDIAYSACEGKPKTYLTLTEGTHPKSCYNNDDCVYSNNLKSTCTCSTTGQAYCSVHTSDSLYERYYTAACNGNYEEMLYWKAYLASYPVRQKAESCAYERLQELIDYNLALSNRYGGGTVHQSEGCPEYQCGQVQETYCALYTNKVYTIGNSCFNGTYCSLRNTVSYAEEGFSKISCANQVETELTATEEEYFFYTICSARPEIRLNTDARLASGTHPKQCEEDS